ncbi:SDR family oxidoreductase [Bacillus dakarensis]|uniref:SDR family oxidoreductase n=1 Tax=Robertmurraya dakarensis TaxID=1926278 RepID=UPI000981D1A6|nr:SDR family oxidoreductase [Bacillus dakarensis]
MKKSIFDLSGRTALITGGGIGLGQIIAEAYAEYGANIALCSRKIENCHETAEQIKEKYGVKTAAYACDISSEEDVNKTVEAVLADFGQIDILVNNSGTTWGANAEEMPLSAWQKVIDVNVTGTFLMSQAVGKHMISRKYGKIINIGSIAGLRAKGASELNAIGYSTSKAAVHHFTRDLALKWVEYGINVNAIAPGIFLTKMSKFMPKEILESRNPMKRTGDPESLQGLALLLASDAGNFTTGQVIAVDGGASL